MRKIKVKKENIDSILLPFKYNEGIIFAKTLGNLNGLYGINKSSLFFISDENLPDLIDLEISDNIEELAEVTQAIEFIVQQIAVNRDTPVSGFTESITHAEKLRPFVLFMTNYEKGLQLVEGIRNGTIEG